MRTIGREEVWNHEASRHPRLLVSRSCLSWLYVTIMHGGNLMGIRDEILAEAYELALQNDMTYSG
jgi:hypothetical protein